MTQNFRHTDRPKFSVLSNPRKTIVFKSQLMTSWLANLGTVAFDHWLVYSMASLYKPLMVLGARRKPHPAIKFVVKLRVINLGNSPETTENNLSYIVSQIPKFKPPGVDAIRPREVFANFKELWSVVQAIINGILKRVEYQTKWKYRLLGHCKKGRKELLLFIDKFLFCLL